MLLCVGIPVDGASGVGNQVAEKRKKVETFGKSLISLS